MLSLPEIKNLIDDQKISDKEAGVIRDAFQGLVELAFEILKSNKKIRKEFYEQYGKSNGGKAASNSI